MTPIEAVLAAHRFGLGARPGETARIASDPRGALQAQLQRLPETAAFARFGDTEAIAAQFRGRMQGAERDPDKAMQLLKEGREHYRAEMAARFKNAIATDAPFVERLVWFWSNHFTVSISKVRLVPLAGAYEREAIRPHVLGRFEDMLLATARHPAMLLYLDNALSVGPGSMAGALAGRGLNENFAREVLELHTVGVDGGYTQDDIIELARLLTGWSVDRGRAAFRFFPARQEPGARTIMGRTYESGEEGGVQALRDLARHPSTARHVARRLATHFVSDAPPPALTDALERSFLDSGGDLAALAGTLVSHDAAFEPQLRKARPPAEYLVATLRATVPDASALPEQATDGILGTLRRMGQLPMSAPSPKGWPEDEAVWLASKQVIDRVEWAQALASRLPATLDARALAADVLGPLLGASTATWIGRAPSPAEALALLIASPEFQRR